MDRNRKGQEAVARETKTLQEGEKGRKLERRIKADDEDLMVWL